MWFWFVFGCGILFIALVVIILILGVVTTRIWPRGNLSYAEPGRLEKTESLADLIATSDVVHIVYVHGIKAEKAGAAEPLADLLVDRLGYQEQPKASDRDLDIGEWPAEASYFGQPIFESAAEWNEARPFVRPYHLIHPKSGKQIRIEEVNYWPLLWPLKTRFLMVPEHDLAGDDAKHLTMCDKWLRAKDRIALKTKASGGRAAKINRWLKLDMMDWGLSDAVVALGTMRVYLNRAMDQAFQTVAVGDDGQRARHVIMSESLGSFVVLDAVEASAAVSQFFYRTDDLYFFANQVPLLELARIDGLPAVPTSADGASPVEARASDGQHRLAETATTAPSRPSVGRVLAHWGTQPPAFAPKPIRQIIAFSDPSDILTFKMPDLSGVKVVNIYDRNTPVWFGLFAEPGAAHMGHLRNKAVWDVLVERRSEQAGSTYQPD